MIRTTARSVLETRAWTSEGRCFAILDATDTPSVPALVSSLPPERAVSLYREPAATLHASIAPYLVQLDEPLFDWLAETLWSEPWGILVDAPADLAAVRRHFRKFLTVRGPAGEEWFFRFYDPRVLPVYLESCTPDERAAFFGPVARFAVTEPASYGVIELARADA